MSSNSRVELVPYSDIWPTQFKQIKRVLASALQDLALSIDHIGSTAVPGLKSKDRIDVQVTLKDLSSRTENELNTCLAQQNFPLCRRSHDHRPLGDESANDEWQKFFILGVHPSLPFLTNIHLRRQGARNWRYPLLFRDYLRAHPEAAACYAHEKEQLALAYADDRDAYTEAKDPICDAIMLEAERWATRSGWYDQGAKGSKKS